MSDSASKFDGEKIDLSLIPLIAETAMAAAMMYGEKKYGRYNYCKGHTASQLVAAAKRHLAAWFSGEENDKDSGVSHLGHAMANCLMILRQQELRTLTDNRYVAPVAGRTALCEEERQPLDEVLITDNYYDHDSVLHQVDERHGTGGGLHGIRHTGTIRHRAMIPREGKGNE